MFLAEMPEEQARALLDGGLVGRERDEHTTRHFLDRLAGGHEQLTHRKGWPPR